MNSISRKGVASKSNSIGVKGAKAMFENGGVRRQRAPSPAPVSMTAQNTSGNRRNSSSSTISSYKERFEIFTAPKSEVLPKPSLRRASSEDNVAKASSGEAAGARGRTRSNSAAEGHWFQARTKIYEQLSKQRSQSELDLRNGSAKTSVPSEEKKQHKKLADEKVETASISDRINKYKSDVETKKTVNEKVVVQNAKPTANINDIKSAFAGSETNFEVKHKSASILDKCKKLGSAVTGEQPAESDTICAKTEEKKSPHPPRIKPQEKKPASSSTVGKQDIKCDSKNVQSVNESKAKVISGDQKGNANNSITIHSQKGSVAHVTDLSTARNFMEELIAAIDNEQHVPMKQLIDLFETMKKENGEMRSSIDNLKSQLNKDDLDNLSHSLKKKLEAATEELQTAQEQIKELSAYREALRENEERCEELEELNDQYLDEIEELKLVMNEMRDQFHDDEVHETIILQQRLDDMARSLRIIHFRLKKADGKLQETEREKEALLEEIKLLQRGTFTDDEIRRMQSLEGDLQTAKEISVELHNRLQKSEERREKVEMEANQLREEIKAGDLENERLRNNILHLRDQLKSDGDQSNLSPAVTIVRQGSSVDMDTLRSNLEASIERENDIKEQLTFAEEDAKMLRKRLRDIEHENEALTKQLKKLTQVTNHKGSGMGSSEHIQTEVIQLENVQLRRNNDKLHQDIDSLQAQIKSLRQKLTLVHDEQTEGPLSVVKNSLYYETKFDKMMQEIRDLRQQLQDKDSDFKRLREDMLGKSRRDQFRRALSIDSDSVDLKKQLDMAQQEAEQLKEKLRQVEQINEQLMSDNKESSPSNQSPNLKHGRHHINSNSTPTNNALSSSPTHQDTCTELQKENSKLVSELNYYRKARPDIAELMQRLEESEQKISSYESQLSLLRRDMQAMEHNLQEDINSLTLKNTILRQLLEVISEHEGDEKPTGSKENQRQQAWRQPKTHTFNSKPVMANTDLGSDSVIAKHISRLPHDIQCQFKEKISYLESQLKEERERSRAAESLLQQVKSSTETHKRDAKQHHHL